MEMVFAGKIGGQVSSSLGLYKLTRNLTLVATCQHPFISWLTMVTSLLNFERFVNRAKWRQLREQETSIQSIWLLTRASHLVSINATQM